jgi:hypothetical protein
MLRMRNALFLKTVDGLLTLSVAKGKEPKYAQIQERKLCKIFPFSASIQVWDLSMSIS